MHDTWRHDVELSEARPALTVEVPLAQSVVGGSGAFLAAASDGRRYWVKPVNNLQAGRVVGSSARERRASRAWRAGRSSSQMSSRSGRWPVATAMTTPCATRGSSRCTTGAGAATTSGCNEVTADRRLHSHDHGWYLPETGPDWTEEALRRRMDEPHVPQYPSQGLDAGEVARLAAALDDVSSADLRAVLQTVPAAWPVTGRELAALGSFIQRRAAAVAQRLRRGEVQP